MAHFSSRADNIPGFIAAAWIFQGTSQNGQKVSLVWMKDGPETALLDITDGLLSDPGKVTPKMKSYLTGLAEVGTYLKSRQTIDEEGVTEDDIERAALLLAFPKAAQRPRAMDVLKRHLDLLQEHKLIEKLTVKLNTFDSSEPAKPQPEAEKPQQPAEKAQKAADPAAQEKPPADKAKTDKNGTEGAADALVLGPKDAAQSDDGDDTPPPPQPTPEKRRRLLF